MAPSGRRAGQLASLWVQPGATHSTRCSAAACDAAVRIPMTDRVESLNAGVAGSILLWHFRGV